MLHFVQHDRMVVQQTEWGGGMTEWRGGMTEWRGGVTEWGGGMTEWWHTSTSPDAWRLSGAMV